MTRKLLILVLFVPFFACQKSTEPSPNPSTPETMYFPSNSDTAWARKDISTLNWTTDSLASLRSFLIQKNTKSFMILVNGRIVLEEYYNGHGKDSTWPWNSAGKTLVSSSIGIAQQEGLLSINNKASQYLGTGWTSAPLAKENLITVKHLLSMTSGLSDSSDFVIKSNLTYMADAGTRWSYNNVFQKLMDVVAGASGQSFENYFNAKIKSPLGMDGFWNYGLIFKIYHSNTRSMARFGLLALNKGKWNNSQVLNETFFNEATSTSQSINPSYGYLWWLNGKSTYMVPGGQTVYTGPLVPSAPSNMYAAMGASDQRIYVLPTQNIVVIRMGDASDPQNPNFAVSGFDEALWKKLKALMKL
ncbi:MULTISPECIES: serine hydrolase domain-containing protein [unclassified Paraflavitalea]|uniref:serine hydrolase domain-containing protein n=1 Tax=unclassified Paraflavitalea TaxID=2798305 RepID=UPI003D33076B